MDNQLKSVSKIFTEKLVRIPDYQRGYAWTKKQLKDFWLDILQLEENQNHYVGVLTFDDVSKEDYQTWEDDKWIITAKNFEPYYVVDGQQRLTTTLILIQSIIERVGEDATLNYLTIPEIRKRYIWDSKPDGVSGSYIFGYHKDNPSYEFLKTKVFNKNSGSAYLKEETIYTQNLQNAKQFFVDKLSELEIHDVEEVFRKVTQHFLFNIYSISSDIDVHVAFEVMNNRGKPLSTLELLKNRLIFLSTKFDVAEYERETLRKRINDCWKSVYHYLGKNKEKPLDDDSFLYNHFVLSFSSELVTDYDEDTDEYKRYRYLQRRYRHNFESYLLDHKFTLRNISNPNFKQVDSEDDDISVSEVKSLSISDIFSYSESLQNSVESWYYMFNPYDNSDFDDDEKLWLDRMVKARLSEFSPLLMMVYQKEDDARKRINLLKAIERHRFVLMILGYHFHSNVIGIPQFSMMSLAANYSNGKMTVTGITNKLEESTNKLISHEEFIDNLVKQFKSGFYKWDGIRYFLFEYNRSMQLKSKSNDLKIDWREMNMRMSDFKTVEHIYPQSSRKNCWKNDFKGYSSYQKRKLKNSLGNLLPLSQPKNSSLSDKCFNDKKVNGEDYIGYTYGCYCEIEIANNYSSWTPNNILERGLKMLKFMEDRWRIKLGDEEDKIKILALEFVEK